MCDNVKRGKDTYTNKTPHKHMHHQDTFASEQRLITSYMGKTFGFGG